MSNKDITVVITSFKSGQIIKNCLNSIDRDCKVILVENSGDLDFKKKNRTRICECRMCFNWRKFRLWKSK